MCTGFQIDKFVKSSLLKCCHQNPISFMMVDMEVAEQKAKRVTCRDDALPIEFDMACRDSNACRFTNVLGIFL